MESTASMPVSCRCRQAVLAPDMGRRHWLLDASLDQVFGNSANGKVPVVRLELGYEDAATSTAMHSG